MPGEKLVETRDEKQSCQDVEMFKSKCAFYKMSGYCNINERIRDEFCRKTCGTCAGNFFVEN